jgi:predicted nucleotidyltransferase
MDISAVVSYMNIIAEQYFNNNAVEMNGFVMIEIL